MMFMMKPAVIGDAFLVSSTFPETEYALWSSTTTYAAKARVIRTSTHRIYESAVGSNTNHVPENSLDPVESLNGQPWWLEVEATDRWKPFDGRISRQASSSTDMQWRIRAPTRCNTVGVLGVLAGTVEMRLFDSAGNVKVNLTKVMNAAAPVGGDTWANRYSALDFFSDAVFYDLDIRANDEVRVTLSANSTLRLGEIVMGAAVQLGDSLVNTGVGFTDYSTNERDYYGDVTRVKRPAGDRAEFVIASQGLSIERTLRVLRGVRSTPALYFTPDYDTLGTLAYGYIKDPSIRLAGNGMAFMTLEVEGAT